MQRDPRAFLWNVREAALAIQSFTKGMDSAAYEANLMAQAAVERKFEIIGEALNQLSTGRRHGGPHSRLGADHGVPQPTHPRLCDGERRHGVEHQPNRPACFVGRGASPSGRAWLEIGPRAL